MGEKPEDAEAIVEADDDDTLGCQLAAIGGGICRGAELKAAAVNPHHHGPLLVGPLRGGPDIEIEAILTAWPRTRIIFECRKTPCAKCRRVAHTIPRRRRLRCSPTVRPDRWCGVRYALERQHAVYIPLVATDVTGLSANLSSQF